MAPPATGATTWQNFGVAGSLMHHALLDATQAWNVPNLPLLFEDTFKWSAVDSTLSCKTFYGCYWEPMSNCTRSIAKQRAVCTSTRAPHACEEFNVGCAKPTSASVRASNCVHYTLIVDHDQGRMVQFRKS